MSTHKDKKIFAMTTAIAYASGKPHIGNTYEIIMADAIARFKRFEGYDVFFQTGTDEHGQKIELKAKEAGKDPQTFVDETSAVIKEIWDMMNTSYDKFIRTTDKEHKRIVQDIFKKLYEQGDIYKGHYEGLYCTPCESFFTEAQLVDGRCPDCGREVQPAKEEAYFFKMSKYADRLIEHINTHPEFIQPVSRKNEMMNNFLLPGLQDLCVSRTSFSWGIPVTFDEGHVTYVWLDALSNYITGLGYECYKESAENFKKYWPEDLHLIGKDIVRFHTIYWPIFLMALGIELPKQVFGHPWLLLGEGKMSKSKGNVLYADTLVKLFGVDAVRYFVLHEMPYDRDGIISIDLIVERYNSELANVLGNLVSRTISMSNKYFEGVVSRGLDNADSDEDKALDKDLINLVSTTAAKVSEKMESFRVADAISEIWNIFKRSNKYIDETYPWVLAKDEERKERLKTVLYNLTESILIGASLLESFMPDTSKAILAQLNAERRDYEDLDKFGLIDSLKVTEKPSILFARLELDKVLDEYKAISGIEDTPAENEKDEEEQEEGMDIETKAEVEYEDFDKLQIQIGEIIHCEEVKKSKKLLCSQIKIGSTTRQILSGIKAWYKPEDLIGKKVLVLVNLKPRQIAGLTSEGMVLCAEDNEGNLSIVSPEKNMRSGAYVC